MLEEPQEQLPLSKGAFEILFKPFEIVTLRVQRS
jgi:hypothetical protein